MRKVVVTTKDRGVFFGSDEKGDGSVLLDARMCIYWSAKTRGVMGLAATGPADGSKISRSVPRLELTGKVTAIMECTEEAVKEWESGKWA